MTVRLSTIKGREADHLLVLSDEYMASLYPAESNHLVSSESLRAGDAAFIGAFLSAQPTSRLGLSGTIGRDELDGVSECVGCVAARFYRDEPYAEIKRLYVAEAHRGGGLARLLMAAIEREIVAQGIDCARLEMGVYQPEADALYRSLGYRDIPPFGDYLIDPLSQFLEKRPLASSEH